MAKPSSLLDTRVIYCGGNLQVMLDRILAENFFQCEIIWKRTTAHHDAKRKWGTLHPSVP